MVWRDLGLNPGLPDHWWTLYPLDQWAQNYFCLSHLFAHCNMVSSNKSLSSSTCTDSPEFLGTLSLSITPGKCLECIQCPHQADAFKSLVVCQQRCIHVLEFIREHHLLAHPYFSNMSCSSYLDILWDWRWVAVQMLFPEFFQNSVQHLYI